MVATIAVCRSRTTNLACGRKLCLRVRKLNFEHRNHDATCTRLHVRAQASICTVVVADAAIPPMAALLEPSVGHLLHHTGSQL